jgi:hypothetical protein
MFSPYKAVNFLPNLIIEMSFLIEFAYASPDENVKFNKIIILTNRKM